VCEDIGEGGVMVDDLATQQESMSGKALEKLRLKAAFCDRVCEIIDDFSCIPFETRGKRLLFLSEQFGKIEAYDRVLRGLNITVNVNSPTELITKGVK